LKGGVPVAAIRRTRHGIQAASPNPAKAAATRSAPVRTGRESCAGPGADPAAGRPAERHVDLLNGPTVSQPGRKGGGLGGGVGAVDEAANADAELRSSPGERRFLADCSSANGDGPCAGIEEHEASVLIDPNRALDTCPDVDSVERASALRRSAMRAKRPDSTRTRFIR